MLIFLKIFWCNYILLANNSFLRLKNLWFYWNFLFTKLANYTCHYVFFKSSYFLGVSSSLAQWMTFGMPFI